MLLNSQVAFSAKPGRGVHVSDSSSCGVYFLKKLIVLVPTKAGSPLKRPGGELQVYCLMFFWHIPWTRAACP